MYYNNNMYARKVVVMSNVIGICNITVFATANKRFLRRLIEWG